MRFDKINSKRKPVQRVCVCSRVEPVGRRSGHFKILSSDWRVLQIIEKWKKNVFQWVSATGEYDTLANTEVSLVFCVYSASPWAVRHKSISCVTSKAAIYSFYNKAMVR